MHCCKSKQSKIEEQKGSLWLFRWIHTTNKCIFDDWTYYNICNDQTNAMLLLFKPFDFGRLFPIHVILSHRLLCEEPFLSQPLRFRQIFCLCSCSTTRRYKLINWREMKWPNLSTESYQRIRSEPLSPSLEWNSTLKYRMSRRNICSCLHIK